MHVKKKSRLIGILSFLKVSPSTRLLPILRKIKNGTLIRPLGIFKTPGFCRPVYFKGNGVFDILRVNLGDFGKFCTNPKHINGHA